MGSFALLMAAASSYADKSVSYRGVTTDETNQTTYTFSAVDLGTETSTRRIVISLMGFAGGARTIVSATIGGVAATIYEGSTGTLVRGLIVASASGATGDVVVTFSGALANCSIGVYALYGVAETPVSTTSASNGTASIGTTVSVQAEDLLIAAVVMDGAKSVTWTGVTEDFDTGGIETTSSRSGGSKEITSADASYSVSAATGSASSNQLIVGVWR